MQRPLVIVVSMCLLGSGCMSLQGVPMPDKPGVPAAVLVGEHVEITTHSDGRHAFKVTRVSEDAIEGDGVRVAYADMTSLQARRTDPAQTGVVLWIALGVAALAAALYLLDHTDEFGTVAARQ